MALWSVTALIAAGPFLFGLLHRYSGNWQLSFWFLTAMAILVLVAGGAAVKHHYLEDTQAQ